MDSKLSHSLAKLLLEEDENDIIKFCFPNEKRKVKCSISILSETSPVFEAMFGVRWCQVNLFDKQPGHQIESNQYQKGCCEEKTIWLDDDVHFNQYHTFKLFMEIIYGLRETDSLTFDRAIDIYFYADKYQVKKVKCTILQFLSDRMECGISETDLQQIIEFVQLYQLDDVKETLDHAKLSFDDENPMTFFDLANKFGMSSLKQQVVNHMKDIPPKDDWTPEILHAIIKCLQDEREDNKKRKSTSCGCFDHSFYNSSISSM